MICTTCGLNFLRTTQDERDKVDCGHPEILYSDGQRAVRRDITPMRCHFCNDDLSTHQHFLLPPRRSAA